MRIIAIASQKGGVGKTTTAVNLASALQQRGKRILLIDLDPQAHASQALGIRTDGPNVYALLCKGATPAQVRQERDGLSVLPSGLELAGAEMELLGAAGREFRLKSALESERNYDFALIDCPPSLSVLTLNALTYARELLVPLQCEYFALQALSKLLETVEVVKKWYNKDLQLFAILATRYNAQKTLTREVIKEIQEYLPGKLLNTVIRENIALAEAPSGGQSIFEYSPKSHGAEDYAALAGEILEKE